MSLSGFVNVKSQKFHNDASASSCQVWCYSDRQDKLIVPLGPHILKISDLSDFAVIGRVLSDL